jgi:hypothetical protein
MNVQYLIIQASEVVCAHFELNDYDLYEQKDNILLNAILTYFVYINVLY